MWQLNNYCQIPASEYKHDVSDNAPITLEEEFGEDICKQSRENISKELSTTNLHFKFVQWPGYLLNKWNDKINDLKKAGINITAHA
ncbi:MAG: hypothetical protein NT127_06660 [Sphingobacteriales bacterium]|nr:hypothetical protein [Sphingobacteriales bacterium]